MPPPETAATTAGLDAAAVPATTAGPVGGDDRTRIALAALAAMGVVARAVLVALVLVALG